MTNKPISEMSEAEALTLFLALVTDQRTCLLIGEVVKDGKRHEIVRRRAESMLNLSDDLLIVARDATGASATNRALGDPDEIVIRILRPQREG